MHERYAKNRDIKNIWSTENKLKSWQDTELVVTDARAKAGELAEIDANLIRTTLQQTPIDIEWWKAKDKELNHDLIAFVEERRRFLPDRLKQWFHKDMTSYDTEEPAFARMLRDSTLIVEELLKTFLRVLIPNIEKYRFTPMLGETHGQWAELQTFGKRVATWAKEVSVAKQNLQSSRQWLKYSKLSGAIGNSADLSPEIQTAALASLGLQPFAGATQIMPRVLYTPLAGALADIVAVLNNIALSIRLNARSTRPIIREPFGKKQKGSSRMPQKQNPIRTEQMEGMKRMAEDYVSMIRKNISTWQERAIEQSCVERVAWPDLFFVVTHSLQTMQNVIEGLRVYPDAMFEEIEDSKGTFAASKAADFLAKKLPSIDPESVYKMVQLAAWNAFEADGIVTHLRQNPPLSYEKASESAEALSMWRAVHQRRKAGINLLLPEGDLEPSEELAAEPDKIEEWNQSLRSLFSDVSVCMEWNDLFNFEQNLKGERGIIDKILTEVNECLVT